MKDNKKVIKNLVIAIILFAILFFGYKFFTKPKEVSHVSLTKSSYQETVLASGRVEAGESRIVTSEVASRLVSLLINKGDTVKKNTLLLKLDSSDLSKNINEAKASVGSASANYNKIVTTSYEIAQSNIEKLELELSQQARELERQTALYDSGAIPLIELEAVIDKINLLNKQLEGEKLTLNSYAPGGSEAKKASASIEQSRVILRNLEQSFGKYAYSSPIVGTVVELNVTEGEFVQPGQVLMKIVDLDDKYAKIEVDEKSITKVYVGQKAFIYPSSDTSLKLETTVREIDKSVDSEKGTVAVKLDIPAQGSDKFLLDLSITAELILKEYKEAYVVDVNYLLYEQDQAYILVEKDSVAVKQPVTVTGSGSKRIIQGDFLEEIKLLNPQEVETGDKIKLISEGE